MKKVLSVLLTLIILSQFAFVVSAADEPRVLYELDYSKWTDPNSNSWKGVIRGSEITVKKDQNGEQYIFVDDKETTMRSGIDIAGPQNGGTITLDYELFVENNTAAGVGMYLSTNGGFGICSEIGQGSISHYNGSTYNSTSVGAPRGDWERITFVVNIDGKTFDVYVNGMLAGDNFPLRNPVQGNMTFILWGASEAKNAKFRIRNLKVYEGEMVPEMDIEMLWQTVEPERFLMDVSDAKQKLDATLSNAVAMTIGNSMARVNNNYVHIDPDNVYVAPFVTADGYTLIPTRFTTETIGCTTEVLSATSFRFSKGGTVMEINMGDKNAIINGQPVEMPTTPVIKHDRLFIPLRFAAETYGKNVFWDDRGLIIISDSPVVREGQEEIIKPLITEIRNHTSMVGNSKYSDVNYSSRKYYRTAQSNGEWGTLDAAKRFMATVNRWSYTLDGDDNKALRDSGLLTQTTLNANYDENFKVYPKTFFVDGQPYKRDDGVMANRWACLSDEEFYNHILDRAKRGIDTGHFVWQFDDWPLNANYQHGGCFCDGCITGFADYLANIADRAVVTEAGVANPSGFNYKEYVISKGVTEYMQYDKLIEGTPVDKLWDEFNWYRCNEFHARLKKDMEEYAGSDIYYSLNNTAPGAAVPQQNNFVFDFASSLMGETHNYGTTAASIYSAGLYTKSMGIDNVISPLPKSDSDKQLMYSGIAMCYATGQQMLVPWDDWLFGSTRYYATVEELGGTYQFAREYPFLLDNYEAPELIGYIWDFSSLSNARDLEKYGADLLEKGMPARALVTSGNEYLSSVKPETLKGLQAIVADDNALSNLSADEKAALDASGVTLVKPDDTASMNYIENAYWTVRNSTPDVYTTLRQNQLYDDAPVVVHAVNYDLSQVRENVEIEINNLYLPAGDNLTVNVFKPLSNKQVMRVKKGDGSTKVTIDSIDRWTVLQILGDGTVHREENFNISKDYNGIGLGTRLSKDKAHGTPENFQLITYSEGLYSATFGDVGSQDEAAFIYRRLPEGNLRQASVAAGFESGDGAHGVMVRDDVQSNARFVALMYDPENGLRIAHRDMIDKAVLYEKLDSSVHKYMKLQRRSDTYEAYVSEDGKNYQKVGEYKISFKTPAAGVFAASPDGKREVYNVKDFLVSEGSFPAENFDYFNIKYGDGKLSEIKTDGKLEFSLATKSYPSIAMEDVVTTFTSSDESILKVEDDGTLIPGKIGKATISATARMGLKSISDTVTIEVVKANPVVYEEKFDDKKLPEGITNSSPGKIEVVNGALRLSSPTDGGSVITDNIVYNQPQNKNMFYEFDFRAHFGTMQPTTGAGVLYGNNAGFAMTSDVNEFNWFFLDDQRFVEPMEGDKWYHIKIYINYDEQYANVWVDDKLIVDKGELKEANCQREGIFWVRGWRLGTDTYYEWDNFNFHFEQ